MKTKLMKNPVELFCSKIKLTKCGVPRVYLYSFILSVSSPIIIYPCTKLAYLVLDADDEVK